MMANGQWSGVLRHVHRLFQGGSVAGLTEGQLLGRFVADRDEHAFEAIVARHGPMVLGVCRGVLDDPHAVEDAFQATFLVLVRKARGLRDAEHLGPWLYGVARKVALRSRADAARRRARTREAIVNRPESVATLDAEVRELRSLVREEVDRLPANDRMAVVFCYLEGLTHEEAADRLGWPVGTVKGRLARARDRLRDRLGRRGVALPAALPGLAREASHLVPAGLATSTLRSAIVLAAGKDLTPAVASAHAVALMEGVVRTMFMSQLKIAAVALGASCAIAVPTVVAYQAGSRPAANGPKPKAAEVSAPAQKSAPTAAPSEQIKVAEQALAVIQKMIEQGIKPVPTDQTYAWSRRLAEAQATPEAIRAHRDRMAKELERAKTLARAGEGTMLDPLESQYRLNEAEGWVHAGRIGPTIEGGEARKGAPGGVGGGGAAAALKPVILKTMPADEPKNKAILAKLEERISMNFPNDTPLEDVKKYIEQSTQDEAGGLPNGIPIYVDPEGLQVADKTMASTIALNIEGIPLRTTLKLLLKQLGLGYKVEAGLLLITDVDSASNFDFK